MIALADFLNWEEFVLIGHSRGGNIASLTAGSFPKRINALFLIEGGAPQTSQAHEAPTTLAQSIMDRARFNGELGRVFTSFERAVKERTRGFIKVSTEAAEILASRGVIEVDDGFTWRADQRLKASSELRLMHEQLVAFLQAIECPVRLIRGVESTLLRSDHHTRLAEAFQHFDALDLPGAHHLHLDESPEAVADALNSFISSCLGNN